LAKDEKKYSQQPRSQDALLLYCKGLSAVSYLKTQWTVGQLKEGLALSALGEKFLKEAGQKEVLFYRFLQAEEAQAVDEHLALEIFSEVYQSAKNCGDKLLMGECLMSSLQIHLSSGNIGLAKGQAEENLAIRRDIGDVDGEALALLMLADIAAWEGNLEEAEELNWASQAGFLAIGNYQYYYLGLFQNAFFDELRGNYTAQRQFGETMWANAKELGPWIIGKSVGTLFWSNYCLHDLEQCDRWCLEAQRSNLSEDTIMFYRGMISFLRGDYRQAATILKKVLFNATGKYFKLQILGIIATALGQNRRAVVLFGAQDRAFPSLNSTMGPIFGTQHKEALQSARAALGEANFQAAWEEGLGMSHDQMIAYALEDSD